MFNILPVPKLNKSPSSISATKQPTPAKDTEITNDNNPASPAELFASNFIGIKRDTLIIGALCVAKIINMFVVFHNLWSKEISYPEAAAFLFSVAMSTRLFFDAFSFNIEVGRKSTQDNPSKFNQHCKSIQGWTGLSFLGIIVGLVSLAWSDHPISLAKGLDIRGGAAAMALLASIGCFKILPELSEKADDKVYNLKNEDSEKKLFPIAVLLISSAFLYSILPSTTLEKSTSASATISPNEAKKIH